MRVRACVSECVRACVCVPQVVMVPKILGAFQYSGNQGISGRCQFLTRAWLPLVVLSSFVEKINKSCD